MIFGSMTMLALLSACAHRHGVPGTVAQANFITVYIGGAVNTPGRHIVGLPFSVEQAIQEAGDLDKFEQDWNRRVVVRRNGQETSVQRKRYSSFRLADGDSIAVPRS